MSASSLSGRRLAGYEVGSLLGAGGMGEVYRARDSKLNRDVAIKILLPAVAGDADRLARFQREAQVLASLNHQNIAHIHGIEEGEAGPFLVMELVEGPTLADRISQGPIAIDEALAIARQIADALDGAHERGVVHRDLKPANIKVSDDGAVKVLDFGLAKALDPPDALASSAAQPTITTPAMTVAGMILGTAAYMSPEQAKGRVVDKRSDVWAFGCVLYEMLTARRAFEGEDVTDTIAAVVRADPDWSALPADTPPQIRLLLKRCLEKDRRARVSDIGVARFLMNEPAATAEPARAASAALVSRRRFVTALAAGLVVGGLLVAAAWSLSSRRPSTPVRPVAFTLTPPATAPLLAQLNDHDVAISPDGSLIVYRSFSARTQSNLVVRATDDIGFRPLPGTDNARYPFISPDGRWVGFFSGPELCKVPIAGGARVVIARVAGAPRGASWGDDDAIVVATAESAGLQRVPANGGELTRLTQGDGSKGEFHGFPHVLPGSKAVLFTSFVGQFLSATVEAVDVATGVRKTVIPSGTDASYASGYLVYATIDSSTDAQSRFRATLRAVRFDSSRVEAVGSSVTAYDGVSVSTTAAANYGLSRRGDLVLVPGGLYSPDADIQRALVWVDRKGQETPIGAQPRTYAVARVSPDGTRIALDVRDQTNDIWIWNIKGQTLTTLNRHPAQDLSPLWTPDSRRIIWTTTRAGGNPNLFVQPADGTGTPQRLTNHLANQFPTSITSDGRTVLGFGSGGSGTVTDVFTVDIQGPELQAQKPLLSSPGSDFDPELSPDGKWLAYHSNESGEFQVYVRPFPDVQGGRKQISTSGGTRPAWSRDGRELFYLDKDGLLTSVKVLPAEGTEFAATQPVKILNTKYYLGASLLGLDLRAYDVAPDGRFLMIKDLRDPSAAAPLASMVVVLNWGEELKARLPAP
jgi:eukaryotic-like serine/threonine-protein kinase